MKILMLHPHDIEYDPWTIRIIKLAQALRDRGHTVTVAYLESLFRNHESKRKLRNVPKDGIEYVMLRPRGRHIQLNFKTVKELGSDVDIIHFQKCFASTFLPAYFAAHQLKKPLHYDWDDNENAILKDIFYGFAFRSEVALLERTIPKVVDSLSTASEGLKELAVKMGYPEGKIFKTPVGADLNLFHPHNDGNAVREEFGIPVNAPLILYLGQLEGAAYVDLYLKAAVKIKEKFPWAKFFVVGGGGLLADLKKLSKKLGLEENVIFTGYRPTKEIPRFVAAADVAVACFEDNPATRCKSPLKIAEYMAAGKAIVASKVGDVPWMLKGSGILVDPGEYEPLAAGITTFLKNPKVAKEMGAQARRRAEKYLNWHWSAEQLEKAYLGAIQEFNTI